MKVKVDYALSGIGWAECTISIGDKEITICASYLSDALRDLLGATAAVLQASNASCIFQREPGCYRWELDIVESGRLFVRIAEVKSFSFSSGQGFLFEAECRPQTFANAVLASAQGLLDKHGLEGYLKLWKMYPFPSYEMDQLRSALKQFKSNSL